MKILLVQDYLRSGGTERQTLLLARAFGDAGHPTRVLTFRPGGTLANTASGIDVTALQTRDSGLDWWAPGLVRAAWAFAPDILLTMGRMANCRGAQLQRALPRAAVIATMRTGKSLPWLFRRSLARVRHVVANSTDAARRIIADHGLTEDRVSVIHNSLVFPPAAQDSGTPDHPLRRQHGATSATTVLLCVAMFRPEKNQRALLPIVAALPPAADWQLWFAGTGPALAECRELAIRSGLGGRVQFFDFVADPTALYRAADIAVLTSERESLSNFLIESQAHGLPAVAYGAQGVGEAIAAAESGLVITPGDANAFTVGLARLIADPVRRAAMGAAAAAHARAHFSPERQTQAYLELFVRLLAADPPPPRG